MNEIKEFFKILDYIVATYWGITIYDLIPNITNGTLFISGLESTIKILFAIVGLIYAFARLITYIVMSRLNVKYREQEIFEKQAKTFNSKWHNEFLKDKENETK